MIRFRAAVRYPKEHLHLVQHVDLPALPAVRSHSAEVDVQRVTRRQQEAASPDDMLQPQSKLMIARALVMSHWAGAGYECLRHFRPHLVGQQAGEAVDCQPRAHRLLLRVHHMRLTVHLCVFIYQRVSAFVSSICGRR